MNFMKYPTKNDISISNAVLKLAKLCLLYTSPSPRDA